jgi:hypothetical protein
VFSTSDVVVIQTDLYAVETTLVLVVNYTVTLNSDQDSNPGGTVNMIVAPAAGYLITLTSAVQNLQSVVLTNGGGFYPQVISDVFDRLTILVQQVAEKTSRALTVAISSGASTSLPPPVANNLLGWDALGASIINYAGMASAAVSAAMAPIVSAATTAAARVGLGAAASGANTDITSLASPALGSATATTQAASDNSTKVATTAFVAGTQTAADARYAGAMPNFTASTASALISASLGTGKVDFRNAALTNGTPVEYNVTSALSLAMNSTAASLGATTAVATSLIYAIVYAAGVPQLAVCNLTGGLQLDETNLITTTAIGSGSTAANVWYSTSAISTPSQYRIVGRVDATWTSGTGWSSPTLVQPVGVGEAMASTNSIGYALPISVMGSRAVGTTYYNNNLAKPRWVHYTGTNTSGTSSAIITVITPLGSIQYVGHPSQNTAGAAHQVSAPIPPGCGYNITGQTGTETIGTWLES